MQAKEFLQLIFGKAPSDAFVRWGQANRSLYPTVEELLEVIEHTTGNNVFFGPAPHRTADGKKTSVLGAAVAWVDADDPENDRLPLLPPSITVASGGPGKHHYYWLMTRFTEPDMLERINKALAAHIGGDHTWDATRILRVPGTMNTKYEPHRPVEIISADPTLVYNAALSLMRLRAYDPKILDTANYKSESERDWAIGEHLMECNVSREYIKMALLTHSSKARREGDHYVEHTLNSLFESFKTRRDTLAATLDREGAPVGEDKQKNLGNVEFFPVAKLYDENNKDRGMVVELAWADGMKQVSATQLDFQTRRNVINILSKHHGSLVWRGSDLQALKLWEALTEGVPPKARMLLVEQAGRYTLPDGSAIFVDTTDHVISTNGTRPDVFWDEQIQIPKKMRHGDPIEIKKSEFDAVLDLSVKSQPSDISLTSLGWAAASLLKPLFEDVGARFPILHFYGMQGSGKTSYIQEVLLPLIGVEADPVASDVTQFALTAHLSSTNALPVWVGEYRPSNTNAAEFERHLRAAYDRASVERGKPNLTISSFHLTAPVITDGESIFFDSATRDRSLSLRLNAQRIAPGQPAYKAFQELRKIPEAHRMEVARRYLMWSLGVDQDMLADLFFSGMQRFSLHNIGARAANNAAVAWVGLVLLRKFAAQEGGKPRIPDADAAEQAILTVMKDTYTPGLGVRTPVEHFCELVAHQFAAQVHWTRQGCDWDEEEEILWFNATTAVHYIRHFWGELPTRDLLWPQLQDRVGLYLKGPVTRSRGGQYFGILLRVAQDLGLDVPTPKPMMELSLAEGVINALR